MQIEPTRPVAVVTGASAGIGKSTARMLVALGWQVIGTGRNPERSRSASDEISAAAKDGGSFVMLRADFDSMADVKRLAAEIAALTLRVDVLINNAGGVRDKVVVTAEGTEATFAANHLAPFLLTRELMPLLQAADNARVIAVSSTAHRMSQGLDWTDLQGLNSTQHVMNYGQAKLMNLLFTRELARRGVIAQAMHPGVVDSNFASHGDSAMQQHMAAAPTVSPDEPAETLVWLATSPEGAEGPGRYFHRKAEEQPSEVARDDEAAARLWQESEQILAGLGV